MENCSNVFTYRSPKTEIRNSLIQGLGSFAVEPIEPGDILFVKAGSIVNLNEAMTLEERFGDYSLQIHENLFYSAKCEADITATSIHLNHSCSPNVGLSGNSMFVALRHIQIGEELNHDAAMTTIREYELTCNCGSTECRGVITGNDWQSPYLQIKYGNHFSSFILEKININRTAKKIEKLIKYLSTVLNGPSEQCVDILLDELDEFILFGNDLAYPHVLKSLDTNTLDRFLLLRTVYETIRERNTSLELIKTSSSNVLRNKLMDYDTFKWLNVQIKEEATILKKLKVRKMLIIGSGYLPMTLMTFIEEGFECDGLDIENDACNISKELLDCMQRFDRINIIHGDAKNITISKDYDCIFISLQVGITCEEKKEILNNVADNGVIVVYRSTPYSLRRLIYPWLDIERNTLLVDSFLQLWSYNTK
eukprot:TRINITY_DN7868_c0_g1_i1.p1 TRINITY_DN7868_c0_g1~~TRINITY_DN7868_c0_g1_i1.p1  ORF type:complete len:423 (-),score=48.38 TRINITY_DN7868_c0_g1_i1:33-1301(-)